MPTYNYKCMPCNIEKEKFHKMSERPEVLCDECKEPMTKLISAGGGLSFKGDRWMSKGKKGY